MLELLTTTCWALETKYYHRAVTVIQNRIAAGLPALSEQEVRAQADVAPRVFAVAATGSNNKASRVAVVKLVGAMQKRDGMCSTGTESLGNLITQLDANPDVSAIVLEIDSPGGAVDGTEALGNLVKNASKPVVAWVNGLAASAGYWIASQTDSIFINSKTTGYVGSIGVLAMHVDESQWLEKEGYKVSILRSTKAVDKARFNSVEPLSDELHAEYVQNLDKIHETFISTVRSGRSGKDLADELFTGKVYDGQQAIKNGLADKIGTLSDAIRHAAWLAGRNQTSNSQSNQATMKFPKLAAFLGISTEASDDAEIREEHMQQAETAIAERDTQISDLQSLVAAKEEELAALQTQVATLESDLKTAIESRDASEQERSSLQTQVTTLETWRQESKARNTKTEDEINKIGAEQRPKTDYEIAADKAREQVSKRNGSVNAPK